MPAFITKYKILVASPSDVQDERAAIDEVINELNQTYGNHNNIVFELIKWETHSAPAASESDVQSIIDKDFGNDYDLFIGILWKKFGTPTMKYGSGTEQEFYNAYNRFKKNSELQILFYFKTAAPNLLSEINPTELEKVNNFKNGLGEKSVLYWEYNTIEELQKFLRIHIPKRITDIVNKNHSANITESLSPVEINKNDNIQESENIEFGILDYVDIIKEAFQYATEAITRISEATTWISQEINKKIIEITNLKNNSTQISNKAARDFFIRTAEILNDYSSRLEPDIPIFNENFQRGCDAFFKLIPLYTDLSEVGQTNISENKSAVATIIPQITTGIIGMQSFLDAIKSLPRMEKHLNRARLNVEEKLEQIVNAFKIALSISLELEKSLSDY